ncbi:MAG: hypothetical protein ACRDRQ_18370, partial [Pseudonocardiaceae bacterium]
MSSGSTPVVFISLVSRRLCTKIRLGLLVEAKCVHLLGSVEKVLDTSPGWAAGSAIRLRAQLCRQRLAQLIPLREPLTRLP